MSPVLLQQIILLTAAVVVGIVVRRQGRRGELSFVLTAMWLSIVLLGVVSAFLLPSIDEVGAALGVVPAALLAGAASTILGAIALILSTRVSRLEEHQRDLTEALGRAMFDLERFPSGSGEDTLIVVPAFNEMRSIGEVIERLVTAGLPVLVVDDGSTDLTATIAREAGAHVISLPINLGVGGALRTGLGIAARTGFGQVVQCDADGQHPLESVLALIAAQRTFKADLLIGSRFTERGSRRSEGPIRFLATGLLSMIASKAAQRPITDATSGLRAIRAPLLHELARTMPAHYLGDTFEVNVMAARAGYRLMEIPVEMSRRTHGSSSASTAAAVRLTIRATLVVLLRLPGIRVQQRRPPETLA